MTGRYAAQAWSDDVGADTKGYGPGGDIIGMDGFGVSGLGNKLFEHFGFTVENVVARARRLLTPSV